ncbi:lytic polysaccharide monooxygenase [Marinicella sp. W31]|uniref:lytic polysaccharide monooxygenase auxiliary activity family 9 protein n=1 Tax=Marinicella sp. W31 TaxID=3023713 RepID=UPI003757D311
MKNALKISFFLTFFLISQHILAHGTMESPISRVYTCYLEGPENPQTAACQAAVALGGTQALYDWNEINQGEADGDHQILIPDGTLCGGGRDKYKGMNLPRTDWTTTPVRLNAQGQMEFVYYATAPHSSAYFRFYVTKDNYNPNQPLGWDDLESPFCEITAVSLKEQRYHMTCPSPGSKTGKHVIYNIWQRDDSPEAFYACVDVDFGDGIDLIFADGFD